MKRLFIILFFLPSCFNNLVENIPMEQQLEKFDEKLFPILVTSFMWEISRDKNIANNNDFSSDEIRGKQFEWARFRSSVANTLGQAMDFCLGIKEVQNKIELFFTYISDGQTCEEAKGIIAHVQGLNRTVWQWGDKQNLKLKFEWIENGQWKEKVYDYPMPQLPINHYHLTWGKTWKNQNPVTNNQPISPANIFFINSEFDQAKVIKAEIIPHQTWEHWQNAQVCFSVDDECKAIIPNRCHLCEKGNFTLFNNKCENAGTTFCGEIKCGERGQPACYVGKHHIKMDDFKGCSPFTEEWVCHKGLEIKCHVKYGAICY